MEIFRKNWSEIFRKIFRTHSSSSAQVAAVKSQHSPENRHGNCMAVNVVSPIYCT